MVVEPAESRLRDLVSLEVGPRGINQRGFRVDERSQLPIDQDVILRSFLSLIRRPGIGIAPRAESVPLGPGDGELANCDSL